MPTRKKIVCYAPVRWCSPALARHLTHTHPRHDEVSAATSDGESSELQDSSKSQQHSPYVVVPGCLDPCAKAMLGHSTNLIDDGNDVPILASDGQGDGRMGSGVGRERHDDDGRAKPVECVRAQDETGSRLTDLGSLSRIETDPPHITALRDDGVARG